MVLFKIRCWAYCAAVGLKLFWMKSAWLNRTVQRIWSFESECNLENLSQTATARNPVQDLFNFHETTTRKFDCSTEFLIIPLTNGDKTKFQIQILTILANGQINMLSDNLIHGISSDCRRLKLVHRRSKRFNLLKM